MSEAIHKSHNVSVSSVSLCGPG